MTAPVKTILLLGAGGREHALAWKMAQSAGVEKIYALPGNDGMAALAKVTCLAGDAASPVFVVTKAQELGVDLVVIGPEKPLAAGVADALSLKGIAVMGPTRQAAQLESSKIFAKQFMSRAKIPTAEFLVCDDHDAAVRALTTWDIEGEGVVIKADGLSAGKGVVVTHDRKEALQTLYDFMINPTCTVKSDRILLEKKISGKEVSAFALCDGSNFKTLGYVCDYKRVFDGDAGPNTGGMGGYAPEGWPGVEARAFIEKNIFKPVLDGMAARGAPFCGVLFAGLMIEGDDINVIEFNTRFGDPETQILMPLLESDIVALFAHAAAGTLAEAPPAQLRQAAAVHVVMASEGYPETFAGNMVLGQAIQLPEELLQRGVNDNALLFVMGAAKGAGQWTNQGGRVLGVTALGATMEEARKRAYQTIEGIKFNGAHWRRDIGK